MESVSVVIPTRNRPEKLRRCLTALAEARELTWFETHVCDSSDAASMREAVQHLCKEFKLVRYHEHTGKTASAARNFGARVATTELLVSVDDDVYVRPDAVLRLLEAYRRGRGWRVVAGSVNWSGKWLGPVVRGRTGRGRRARPGEPPDFLISAFFLYPRALALALPWNTRMRRSEDMFMGALWRSKGVTLLFEPSAQAVHDEQHHERDEREMGYVGFRTYANLFDALLANRNLLKALAIEFSVLAVGAKRYFSRPRSAWAYLAAWYRAHRAVVRDWRYWRALVRKPLPGGAWGDDHPLTKNLGRGVEQ
jgi:glycosyltransferase involved in cell wall biosynthesis